MRYFQVRLISGRGCAIVSLFLLLFATLLFTIYLTRNDRGDWNGAKIYADQSNFTDNDVIYGNRGNHIEYQRPCQEINVAIVCGGFNATKSFYVLLKSILFHRTDIIHLHLFVDSISHSILKELFKTWVVADLHIEFYNLTNLEHEVSWITSLHYSHQYGLMKLTALDTMISLKNITKVIMLDSDMLVLGNINRLWHELSNFHKHKVALGLVENQSDWYLDKGKLSEHRRVWPALGKGFNSGLILADLEELSKRKWTQNWRQVAETELATYLSTTLADQDIMNAFIRLHSSMVLKLPCSYNIQLNDHASLDESCDLLSHDLQIVHWNSPRKLLTRNVRAEFYKNWYLTFKNWDAKLLEQSKCTSNLSSLPTNETSNNGCDLRPSPKDRIRTYLYYQDFELELDDLDVTLVVHLSIDRLQTLDELALHWKGPISAAIYLSELETQLLQSSIEMSSNLAQRKNIGYHLAFRDYGFNYPINRLRNIALNNALTSYVFMSDVDFLPSFNLYDYLKKVIAEMIERKQSGNVTSQAGRQKWALIVPAFESLQYKFNFPTTKSELLTQLSIGSISIFREQIWPAGQSATDYARWKVTAKPYRVEWKPEYEPFIVTSKEVKRFDERFVGFGWNKVENIMNLAAQDYQFWVLPEAFIIHKLHSASFDIVQHRQSIKYRSCIRQLKMTTLVELRLKYPDFFDSIKATATSQ